MRKLFLLVAQLFFTLLLFGQPDSNSVGNKQFHTYYGLQVTDFKDLNTMLEVSHYPKLHSNNFSVGLGMIKITKKKIIIQQEIFTYSQTKKIDTISTAIRSIGIGQSIFGYSYIYNEKLQMYSLFGLTYFNTTVKVTKEIYSPTQFSNYTSSIGNQIEMRTSSFLASLTTHINYIVKVPNNKNRLVLGVRGAYYFPLDKSKWMMNKAKLNNGPNINAGGYALNFVLGFTY